MLQNIPTKQDNMKIPSLYKQQQQNTAYESSWRFLRTLTLINRLLKDEWETYLYTKFDMEHNYYRYGIRDEIANVFRVTKRMCDRVLPKEAFDKLDSESCDIADDIYNTVDVAKNRIKTNMVERVPYKYVDALTNIVMTYVFAHMGESLVLKTTLPNKYRAVKDFIDAYVIALDIEVLKDDNKMYMDDETADMLVNRILKTLKL